MHPLVSIVVRVACVVCSVVRGRVARCGFTQSVDHRVASRRVAALLTHHHASSEG